MDDLRALLHEAGDVGSPTIDLQAIAGTAARRNRRRAIGRASVAVVALVAVVGLASWRVGSDGDGSGGDIGFARPDASATAGATIASGITPAGSWSVEEATAGGVLCLQISVPANPAGCFLAEELGSDDVAWTSLAFAAGDVVAGYAPSDVAEVRLVPLSGAPVITLSTTAVDGRSAFAGLVDTAESEAYDVVGVDASGAEVARSEGLLTVER